MDAIKIAICDDEEYILKMLKKMVERYIINVEFDLNIKVETYNDARSLLNNIELHVVIWNDTWS